MLLYILLYILLNKVYMLIHTAIMNSEAEQYTRYCTLSECTWFVPVLQYTCTHMSVHLT